METIDSFWLLSLSKVKKDTWRNDIQHKYTRRYIMLTVTVFIIMLSVGFLLLYWVSFCCDNILRVIV
jgi:hypothetical protein